MKNLLNRTTPIVLIGAHRLQYFTPTLEAILKNRGNRPLFIFLDKSQNPGACRQKQHIEYIKSLNLSNIEVFPRPRHFGLARNIIGARRTIFEEVAAEYAFIMEDDMVISKHYFDLCENLMVWCQKNYTNVGVVQGWNQNLVKYEEGMENLVEVNTIHWWGYLLSRNIWNVISPTLYEYEEMLPVRYKSRNFRQIQGWINKKVTQNTTGVPINGNKPIPMDLSRIHHALYQFASSQDAVTAKACYMNGFHKVCTYLNRGHYIGEWGEHKNPNLYKRLKMDQLKPWEFDNDANRMEFKVC